MSVWNRFSKEDIIFGMMVSHYTKDFLSYFLTLFPLIYSSFSTTSLAPVIKFPFFSTLLKRLFVTWMSSILTRSSYPVIKTPYLLFSLVTLSRYTWRTTGGKLLSHFSRFSYCRLISKRLRDIHLLLHYAHKYFQ